MDRNIKQKIQSLPKDIDMQSRDEYGFFSKCPAFSFETADEDAVKIVGETRIFGLIVDRNSKFVVTLRAMTLISCSAYIFSYTTRDGVEKVIIYHARQGSPVYVKEIAAQIASETDLSTVSIIIATAGNDAIPHQVSHDMRDIGQINWERFGFTNKIQILFGNTIYSVNSRGQHGILACKSHLIFNTLPKSNIKAEPVSDEKTASACSLL